MTRYLKNFIIKDPKTMKNSLLYLKDCYLLTHNSV